jgi:hypothetical protein
MTSAYFAPLVNKPIIIDGIGQYKTRKGEVIDIITYDHTHRFSCIGTYPYGEREGWHRSGRIYAGFECDNDIVEKL